jgi:hypothetical protein
MMNDSVAAILVLSLTIALPISFFVGMAATVDFYFKKRLVQAAIFESYLCSTREQLLEVNKSIAKVCTEKLFHTDEGQHQLKQLKLTIEKLHRCDDLVQNLIEMNSTFNPKKFKHH